MRKKQSVVTYLSFPQAKRVGNPSEKKDSGQAGMTNNGFLTYEPINNSHQRSNAGFTLVELLITMVVFVLAIAAASQIFTGLLTQFKQQSKIAETNIEGIVGLDMLRRDIEHAGYGLPWNVTGVSDSNSDGNLWDELSNYNEASSSTYNDGSPASALPTPANKPRAPRAILSGNNTGTNGSDYLVIKSASIARNDTAGKSTILSTGGVRTWVPDRENVNKDDSGNTNNNARVIVISPGATTTNSRSLVVSGGAWYTTYGAVNSFKPSDDTDVRMVYGIDDNTDLRMPFNRADYYISSSNVPQRCASGTGVLVKGTINQGDGGMNTMPLIDCVADFQVIFRRDTDADGTIDTVSEDISALTATQIRDQVKEIRAYILAHEGQKDINYTHSPTTIYVGESSIGGGHNYSIGTNVNYRWKIYTIVVKPLNLR